MKKWRAVYRFVFPHNTGRWRYKSFDTEAEAKRFLNDGEIFTRESGGKDARFEGRVQPASFRLPRNIGITFNGEIMRKNPSHGPNYGGDLAAATELMRFIENDSVLYHQQFLPILKNVARKMHKGIYSPIKAVKLWGYLVESGAKKYAKEFGSPGDKWHAMFDVQTRKLAASQLASDYAMMLKEGEYDTYLQKDGIKGFMKTNPMPRFIQKHIDRYRTGHAVEKHLNKNPRKRSKKPSPAQLAARRKFVKMVRARAKNRRKTARMKVTRHKRGTATRYKFSRPVTRAQAEAMIAQHKAPRRRRRMRRNPQTKYLLVYVHGWGPKAKRWYLEASKKRMTDKHMDAARFDSEDAAMEWAGNHIRPTARMGMTSCHTVRA